MLKELFALDLGPKPANFIIRSKLPAIVSAALVWPCSSAASATRRGSHLASTATTATRELKYDGFSIFLHWLTALLVATLWLLGQSLSFFPKGSPRLSALGVHMLLGMLVGAVILVRIVWRSSGGRHLPAADEGLLNLIAKGAHYGLYLLLVLTVGFGVARAWVHGVPVFDWFKFQRPGFATPSVIHTISELHSDLADILVIVAGLHAAAALMHHYVMRDSVLRRMLPRKRAG
jgi:cytochrome b561